MGRRRPNGESVVTATGPFVLRRVGRTCVITNPPGGLLELLVTNRTTVRSSGPLAHSERLAEVVGASLVHIDGASEAVEIPAISRFERMYKPVGPREVSFDIGLLPVVTGFYAARGIAVRVEKPWPDLPPPAPAAAWQVVTPDPVLLEAIQTRTGALVRYDPTHVDPVRLVGEMALAWPTRRVVLACGRRAEVRRAVAHLRAVGLRAEAAYGDGRVLTENDTDPVRAWAATWRGAMAPDVEIERASVVVMYNAREALGGLPTERVLSHCHGRVVGLLPEHEPLSHYERDRLWALTGMPPLVIPRHGLVRRSVRVVTIRNDAPVVPPDRDGVDLLRQGVWRHPARNRRLAWLVDLLRRGRVDELGRQHPDVAAALGGRPVGRVIVLTTVVEHAEVLTRLIPNATMITGPMPGRAPVETDRTTAGTGSMIVTPDALGVMALQDHDVLVRADAGTGLPPGLRPEHLYAHQLGPELLVVDVADRHHPELRRAARRRERAYHAAGWAVGPNPCLDALRAFEASRPRGTR